MAEQNIFQKALDRAIKFCGVTARHLADKAKTSESNLSKFRLGTRDVYTETLAKYFMGLPIEGKRRFLEEVLGESVELRNRSLLEMVERLDPNSQIDREEAAEAFQLIAEKFIYPSFGRNSRELSDSRETTDELRQLTLIKSP